MKLHVKLALLVIFLILATGSLSVFFVSQTMHEATVERLEKQAMLIGATMAEHITHSVINKEVVAVREALEFFLERMEDVEYVYVVDFDGQVSAHTFEGGLPRVFLEHKPAEKITTGGIKRYSIRDAKIFDVYYPFIPGMRAHLHIGMKDHDPFAAIMILRIFGVAAAIMFFGSLLAILMSRRITRPLSLLSDSLRSFGKETAQKELEYIGGGQEIAELTNSFNRMMADKRNAEETVRFERNKLINILNSMEDGIYIVNQQYDIEYVNPVLKNDFGPFEGIKCYAYFHDRTEVCPWCKNQEVFAGKTVRWEWYSPKNQKTYDLIDTPMKNANGSISKLEIFRDITERKRSEEELKKYAEALKEARNNLEQKVQERTKELKEVHEELVRKEKLAVLGQLSSGVGHELRNPLGVIKNACYFLNMKMETIQDEAVKENIEIMNREINTANKIIADLLDFARIKEPIRQDTDINQLIADTLSKSLIPENIRVNPDFVEDIAPLSIDPIQVGQIFLNLIENAVHAMKEGGTLKISTRLTNGATEVIFDDDGCGIPKENLEKIFEPLFTTKAKGIGLGLAVSKSLVKANRASILVESEEGKGSKFVVRFREKEV